MPVVSNDASSDPAARKNKGRYFAKKSKNAIDYKNSAPAELLPSSRNFGDLLIQLPGKAESIFAIICPDLLNHSALLVLLT